jgi:long-chain acyl-CoA synthetase
MSSFRELLFERIAARGDSDALIGLSEQRHLSGKTLLDRIDAVAATLAASGLKRQDRIMTVLPNSMAFSILYLACLRGGYTIVPSSPDTLPADLAYMTQLVRPKIILVEEMTGGTNRISGSHSKPWSMKIIDGLDSGIPRTDLQPGDLFSITFTSGSTSRPKAVLHRAESMLANAEAFNRFLGTGPEMRMLHVMPMYYMAGLLNTLLCPLFGGGCVVVDDAFTPRTGLSFWRKIIDNKIDSFWLSPTMAQIVMKLDRNPDSATYARERLRFCLVGTAALPPWLFHEFFKKYQAPLLQSYGLSELLLLTVDRADNPKPGSVGFRLPEVEMKIAADGELLVSTPFAFAGYLDPENSEKSATVASGSLREYVLTGDLAEFDADGRVTITGRKKDLIIVGGINVSPTAIEHLLMSHDAVRQVAVLGVADPLYGEKPVAFVSLVENAKHDGIERALEDYVARNLPEAARPVRYILRDSLPTGPTGKIQKQRLAQEITS